MKANPKVGAVVVTFNRPEKLNLTLKAILGCGWDFAYIFVADNGRSAATEAVVRGWADRLPVDYHAMSDNLGPAGGAAHGFRELIDRGAEYVTWSDDDESFGGGRFDRLMAVFDQSDRIGAVGRSGYYWSWRTGQLSRVPDEDLSGATVVDCINGGGSQLTVKSEVVEAVGLPRADLFWGFEDIEYSLRIARAGYTLAIDGDGLLSRRAAAGRLGAVSGTSRSRAELGMREYYDNRNYLAVMKGEYSRYDLMTRRIATIVAKAAQELVRHRRAGWPYAALQARAIGDGLRGRLGARVPPENRWNEA